MDIAYLLWLQGLRESLPAWVGQFFMGLSDLANSKALVVIPCLLYWCLDKRAGQFLVCSLTSGAFFNQFVKNTVCCYRPWIRSDAIEPHADALDDATGYSFPSGHTQTATGLIGAWGWYYRKRHRAFAVLCWVFVALVAFSRNFLGVHTPQDVLVALLEGIAFVAFTNWLLTWVDGKEGRDACALVVSLVAVVAFIAYVALKPYPLDYDASGTLVVDPAAMLVDCYKAAGAFAGFVVGWFAERRTLSFEVDPEAGWKRLALRFALGMAVVLVLHVAANPLQMLGMSECPFQFVKNFLTIFGAAFVAPALFCAAEKRLAR